ncbi:hypothetical protein CLU79DRAFT_403823 [Phycomyces nitens]|nr:hypothetical protein CLU79DRAFT_403823 [Phycomyces nitens]
MCLKRPVRCCNTCNTLIQMQQMNSSTLSSMPLKQLKYYIDAYNLFAKTAIEKGDLVLIILNTRPISNDHEVYYRSKRIKAIKGATSRPNRTSQDFSLSGMLNDMFGNPQTPQRPPSPQSTPQQRYPYYPPPPNPPPPPQPQRYTWEYSAHGPQTPSAQPTPPPPQPPQPQHQPQPQPQPQAPQPQPQPERTPRQQPKTELTLDDMIKSNINPANLSVRTLKAILRSHYVEQYHLIEKSEFVSCVERLLDERRAELKTKQQDTVQSDDTLCRICCDAQQNCVYLNCGHMMTCMDCGKKVNTRLNEYWLEREKKEEKVSHQYIYMYMYIHIYIYTDTLC